MAAAMSTSFIVYLLGFLDLLGISLVLPLLLRHGERLGADPMLNGVIGSVYGGVQMLSSPLCGSLSDRYGRVRVLRVTLAACCLSYVLLAFSNSLLLLLLSRLLSGMFKHTQTLCRTLAVDGAEEGGRQRAIGLYNAVSSVGFVAGPPIGGHLAEMVDAQTGFQVVTMICAGLFCVMLVLSVLLLRGTAAALDGTVSAAANGTVSAAANGTVSAGEAAGTVSAVAAGTVSAAAAGTVSGGEAADDVDWWAVADLMLVRAGLCLAVLLFRTNFSATVAAAYGVTAVQLGWLMSLQGVVSAGAGALLRYWERLCGSRPAELLVTSGLFCAALAAVTVAPDLLTFTLALVPLCACTSSLRACVAALQLDRSPRRHHGLVMGAAQNVASLGRLVSPLVAGVVQQAGGERAPAAAATVCAGAALVASAHVYRSAGRRKLKLH